MEKQNNFWKKKTYTALFTITAKHAKEKQNKPRHDCQKFN